MERLKQNEYNGDFVQSWFWRTQQQNEIDYIEDDGGNLSAFEFKWKVGKVAKVPTAFREAYPDAVFHSINPSNYTEFVS